MRPTALKLTAVILSFCGFSSLVKAQSEINVVTTAVPFLRISPDARSGGMGELGVATSPDAYAGLWNMGKVAFNTCNAGIGATYTPWLKDVVNDVYLATLSGYYKFDDNQAITGSFRYFNLGNITFTDNAGFDISNGRPREFGIDVGYSRRLSSKSGIGIALKYINSDLTNGYVGGGASYKAGSSVAADLGYYHDGKKSTGSGWTWGATLTNLGSKISYTDNADAKDFIPANLGLGATYTKRFNDQNQIMFGVDVNKLLVPTPPGDGATPDEIAEYRDKGVVGSWFSSWGDAPDGFGEEMRELMFSFGTEYTYNNQFSLRAGYFLEHRDKGNRRYFTAGLGVNYNVFGFNFAYLAPSGSGVNRNPLSNTLRFSVLFNFCNKKTEVATQLPEPAPAPKKSKPAEPKPAEPKPVTPAPTPTPPPARVDTDGDGIYDDEDRCPRTPGIASNRGCPDLTIYFKRDIDALDAEDKQGLDQVVTFLKNNPSLNVTLEGHASTLGTTEHNQHLSERRVFHSKEYLVAQGIAAGRIQTVAFGERFPIGDQKTEEGRAKSRRVHVKINF